MIHPEELLSAYLDGEASPTEAMRIDRHLADCHRCRIKLVEFNSARAAVRSLPVLEVPAHLQSTAPGAAAPPLRRPAVWVGAAAAIAASIITVATIVTPEPEPVNLADVSRQFGARAALDVGAAPLKMVVPASEVVE